MLRSKRFHVVAWGSRVLPCLDFESDVLPDALYKSYPYVHIALQQEVRVQDLRDGLANHDGLFAGVVGRAHP